MAQIQRINATQAVSRIGFLVKQSPQKADSMVYLTPDSTTCLGVIASKTPYRAKCDIITSGEALVFVVDNVRKGDVIRTQLSTDNISGGACKVVQSADTTYLQIGTALESGKGLVKVLLNIAYISGGAGGGSVTSNEMSVVSSKATSLANAISVLSQGISVRHTSLSEPTGFDNRTDSAWTFTDGTLTLAVTTVGGYNIWFDGVGHNIAVAKNIVITDVEGIHLIYFDTDDVLHEYVNPTMGEVLIAIRDKCLVAYIYWDATNKNSVYVGEERHGCIMDGMTHYYLHYTRGLQYISGLGLSGFTIGDGSLDTHAQFGVDEGSVSDEDIGLTISAIASNVGLPIVYMENATGDWRLVTQAGYSCYQNPLGATNRLMYNEWTGATWQATEVGEGNYVLYHIFATTGKVLQMYSVMGQAEYATRPAARAGAKVEMNSLVLGTLPSVEMRPIATVIYQTDKDYANAVNARIVEIDSGGDDYVDWRSNDLPRGVAATDYTALSNAISAVEVRVSALSDSISNEISNRVSASAVLNNKISNETSNRTSASAVLDAKISTLSARVVSGLTSIDGRATSLDNAISVVSNALSALEVRVSTLSAAPGGGGSVTSNELSIVRDIASAAEVHASTISARVVSVSAELVSLLTSVSATLDAKISNLSADHQALSLAHVSLVSSLTSVDAHAAAASAAATSVGALLSAHNIQLAFVADTQSIQAISPISAGATVSGLSVSLAVSGLYTMDAMIFCTTSNLAPIRFGMIFPKMVRAGGNIQTQVSVVAGGGSNTQSTVNLAIGWFNETYSSVLMLSVAGIATINPVLYQGTFLVSDAAGKLKLMAAGSVSTTNAIHILKGSYLRVYKIQ